MIKKNFKIGDIIKVKKEHCKFFKNNYNEIREIDDGLDVLLYKRMKKRKKIWGFIYEIYPDLKNFNCELDYIDGKILVIEKLSEKTKNFIQEDLKKTADVIDKSKK